MYSSYPQKENALALGYPLFKCRTEILIQKVSSELEFTTGHKGEDAISLPIGFFSGLC